MAEEQKLRYEVVKRNGIPTGNRGWRLRYNEGKYR